jgi:predicted dehydrogenase
MSKRLRVGVIGCGGIAQMMHLPHLAERPDLFEIAGLVDPNRAVLDAVGDRYGVARRFSTHQELLAVGEVDAVMLLNSGSHLDATVASLKAGKHVFVEKPVAIGVREAETIAEVAREVNAKKPVTLMVGYHKRYDPAYRAAREAVGKMKDLRMVLVSVLHPDDGAYRTHHAVLPVRQGKPYDEPADIAGAAKEAMSGSDAAAFGAMVGEGAPASRRVAAMLSFGSLIHDVNLVRGVIGEPTRVVSNHVWQEGFAQSSLSEFARGVRVQMSWINVPFLKHYEETVRFVGHDERVTLVFPSPYLRHHPTKLLVERMQGETLVVEDHTPSFEEAFRVELFAFRDAVLEGKKPETDIADAIGDARWLEGLARASTV